MRCSSPFAIRERLPHQHHASPRERLPLTVLALSLCESSRAGIMDSPSFLRVVGACDNFPYGPTDSDYYELYLPENDQPYGLMLPEIVEKMPWTPNFEVNHVSRRVKVLDSS